MIAIYRRSASFRPACLALILSATGLHAQTPAPAPATPPPAPAPAVAAPAADFGDFSSAAITGKAWAAFTAKDYPLVLVYTAKCRELFEPQAVAMQKTLTAVPTENQHSFWALNDVGTCYYLQGQSQQAMGKTPEAITSYKFLVDNLSFAQCWDTKGWFWKPADAARGQLKTLEFGAL